MKFTEAAISLEPRSIGSCLDLAVMFAGRHLRLWLTIVLIIAVPTCAAVYGLARWTTHGLLWAILCVGVMSVPLGTMLIAAAARLALGQKGSARSALRDAFGVCLLVMLLTMVLRPLQIALGLAGLIPGLGLGLYTSFLSEARVLARWRAAEHEHRVFDLVQLEFGDLMVRATTVSLFGLGLWFLLTMTADATSLLLFGVSPCVGRLSEATRNPWDVDDWERAIQAFWTFVSTDAVALTTVSATALVTYAICRLAWFFAYVDLRIRRDCWDLEVALAEEARRGKAAET